MYRGRIAETIAQSTSDCVSHTPPDFRLFEETQLSIISKAKEAHPATWDTLSTLLSDAKNETVSPARLEEMGIYGCVDVEIGPCITERTVAALYLSAPCVLRQQLGSRRDDFSRDDGDDACVSARHDHEPVLVTTIPGKLPIALQTLIADTETAGGHVWWLPPAAGTTIDTWVGHACSNETYSANNQWGRYLNDTTAFSMATTYYELEAPLATPDITKLVAMVKMMLIDYIGQTTFLATKAARAAFVERVSTIPVKFGGGGAGDRCVVGTTLVNCMAERWSNAKTDLLAHTTIDQYRWDLSPLDVNAIFSPLADAVFIPYGIAQLPFYSDEWEEWMQMASLGAVIAHEVSTPPSR